MMLMPVGREVDRFRLMGREVTIRGEKWLNIMPPDADIKLQV